MHSIRKMDPNYKNRDSLKILPFYSSEIKNDKKRQEKLTILIYYLDYHHLLKNLLILIYRKNFHFFHQKEKKDLND